MIEFINKLEHFLLILNIALISTQEMVEQLLWEMIKRGYEPLMVLSIDVFDLSDAHVLLN
jgi:hypothetical protein